MIAARRVCYWMEFEVYDINLEKASCARFSLSLVHIDAQTRISSRRVVTPNANLLDVLLQFPLRTFLNKSCPRNQIKRPRSVWRGFWFLPVVLDLNLTGARKEGSSRRSGTLSQVHPPQPSRHRQHQWFRRGPADHARCVCVTQCKIAAGSPSLRQQSADPSCVSGLERLHGLYRGTPKTHSKLAPRYERNRGTKGTGGPSARRIAPSILLIEIQSEKHVEAIPP